MQSPWAEFFGRLHPILLHIPIGALVALIALELWEMRRKDEIAGGAGGPDKDGDPGARRLLAGLTALAALVTVSTGWFHGEELGYTNDTFLWHRGLGISFAVVAILLALATAFKAKRVYGALLCLAAVLLVPLAHKGATMTHGEGYLLEPFAQEVEPEVIEAPTWYESHVAPILTARCVNCHGPNKQKAQLAMHEPALLMKGSENGPVLIPGDAAASEMLRHMRLPLDHDEHMPPEGKGQPTEAEIAALEAWIAAGASFEDPAPAGVEAPVILVEAEATDAPLEAPLPAERPAPPTFSVEDAIAVLAAQQVHVEIVDPTAGLLWIDFGARPATDDAFAREHLEPLRDVVVDLSLAGTAVGDDVLEWIAAMPHLERLDLSHTRCTSEGIAHLEGHASLRSINLTSTAVDEAAASTLLSLQSLERVYIWGTKLSPNSLGTLVIDDRQSSVLEIEPSLTDAPVAVTAGPVTGPVNETCPVSGSPVDLAFQIVFEGKVIGFCCEKCPGRFWEDPASFPVVE
jgi:uncharacterized membrane protein/YHS domain-containing protein